MTAQCLLFTWSFETYQTSVEMLCCSLVLNIDKEPLRKLLKRVAAFGTAVLYRRSSLQAISEKVGPVSLVHFDSHFDTWDEYFGEKCTHGTPFKRVRCPSAAKEECLRSNTVPHKSALMKRLPSTLSENSHAQGGSFDRKGIVFLHFFFFDELGTFMLDYNMVGVVQLYDVHQ